MRAQIVDGGVRVTLTCGRCRSQNEKVVPFSVPLYGSTIPRDAEYVMILLDCLGCGRTLGPGTVEVQKPAIVLQGRG